MSAKRSWDIERKQRPKAPRAPQAPARIQDIPVRRVPDPILARPARRQSSKTAARAEPLRARRRRARQVFLIALALLIIALVSAAFYGLWRPGARVEHVDASGPHADAIPALALSAVQGTYGHVIPKNSIFFVPDSAIRASILDAYPDIDAVSIARKGLDALSITAFPRVSAFVWCGASVDSPTPDGSCYESDAEGFLFASVPAPSTLADASTTGPVATSSALLSLRIYAPLAGVGSSTPADPLRATVSDAPKIPDILRFERALTALGADIVSIQLRDLPAQTGEADLFTIGGTRITYLMGQESAAAALAAAAFPQLSLNDGSLEYVDLRFGDKVYFKKKGE